MQNFDFPVSLVILAIFSLLGVFLIRKGLSHPIPVPEEDTWKSADVVTELDERELQDIIDEVKEPEY